ncbi:MAG: hypothetical protein QOD06_705 [Candidatus Binatota bacterium]|nr:hypothetical protein [Candidatus Binatota bacterium]
MRNQGPMANSDRKALSILSLVFGGLAWADSNIAQAKVIWRESGQRVICNADAVPAAAAIAIYRDGTRVCTGDQLVFAYDVDPTRDRDFRQALVIDTNGLARVRHLDGDAPARTNPDCTDTTQEDCFGSSIKLPPGLILSDSEGADRFFLSSQVRKMNLLTDGASDGVLRLEMKGRPADRGSAFDPDTAPVAVRWLLTIPPPKNRRTIATIDVTAAFRADVRLSEARAANAEAFRAAELSSSNVDADHTSLGTRTHDADQLLLVSSGGQILEDLDANAAPRNCLLLPDGSGACPDVPEGTAVDGKLELNQRAEAPTNGDPPNVRVSILPAEDAPEYRGQAFITLDETTTEQSDNFGAWISRTVPGGEIEAGSRFEWAIRVVATD